MDETAKALRIAHSPLAGRHLVGDSAVQCTVFGLIKFPD